MNEPMDPQREEAANTKWIVGLIVALVLGAVLAVPLGLSLIALLPPLALVIIVGFAYAVWRNHEHAAGHEKHGKGGGVELVGGRASRRRQE
jgi:hypothetical protein